MWQLKAKTQTENASGKDKLAIANLMSPRAGSLLFTRKADLMATVMAMYTSAAIDIGVTNLNTAKSRCTARGRMINTARKMANHLLASHAGELGKTNVTRDGTKSDRNTMKPTHAPLPYTTSMTSRIAPPLPPVQ
mmetsp:Transcript_49970/g.99226  ORF Transcript_49970/g.99226 Transcript_49970/m.99226 type:complete len:135 (-) Transcript_49970:373-777(-)